MRSDEVSARESACRTTWCSVVRCGISVVSYDCRSRLPDFATCVNSTNHSYVLDANKSQVNAVKSKVKC